MKWISIKDELPKISEERKADVFKWLPVMVYANDMVMSYTNGDIPIIASVPFHRSALGLKYYEDDIEAIANARLIENAPDMLEALLSAHIALEYVSEYDIPLCTKERVKKVIENATGLTVDEVLIR